MVERFSTGAKELNDAMLTPIIPKAILMNSAEQTCWRTRTILP